MFTTNPQVSPTCHSLHTRYSCNDHLPETLNTSGGVISFFTNYKPGTNEGQEFCFLAACMFQAFDLVTE